MSTRPSLSKSPVVREVGVFRIRIRDTRADDGEPTGTIETSLPVKFTVATLNVPGVNS